MGLSSILIDEIIPVIAFFFSSSSITSYNLSKSFNISNILSLVILPNSADAILTVNELIFTSSSLITSYKSSKRLFNTNQVIGVIKSPFVRSIMFYESPDKFKELDIVNMVIKTKLIPIRDNRKAKRANVKNVSRRSYRYSY